MEIKNVELDDAEIKNLVGNGLSAYTLVIPKVYEEFFTTDFQYYLLAAGRIAGKTCGLIAKWWQAMNAYPDEDVVICQSTQAEINDSIVLEIEKFLKNSEFDVGDTPDREFYIPKSYDRIIWRGHTGETRIFPITDYNGGQRSRGKTTKNKISLVLYEEAQKNKDRNVLEQSIATFVRQLSEHGKIIVVGNNETVGHWFVDFVEEKKADAKWKYIYATYLDIWELLNRQTQEYIEGFRISNYTEYRRMFLGDIYANTSTVVFPQFTRKRCYKRIEDIEPSLITTLIVGVDHATANDTFAIVPIAILNNGRTMTLNVCYDDPEETNRTLAPTEQCDLLDEFMRYLDYKYGFVANAVPIILSCDGAASPFIKQLEHLKRTSENRELWKNIKIKGFTLKKKDINLGIIKNAFAFGVLTILNEGSVDWRGQTNKHRLASEIERQRYKAGKLDEKIKNDLCDALEYGLVPFYNNCYNISFPVRVARNESHYDDIRRAAKIIK